MSKYPATLTWARAKNVGTGANLDDLKGGSGFFEATNPTTGSSPNGGSGAWILMVVAGGADGKAVQLAINKATGAQSIRYFNASVWSAWALQTEVADAADMAFDDGANLYVTGATVEAALNAIETKLADLETRVAAIED